MNDYYFYRELVANVKDDDEVEFTVKFNSSGNTAKTVIDDPDPTKPEISITNEGKVTIGRGKDLRNHRTIVSTCAYNPLPITQEAEIRIQYFINGKLLVEHSNQKEKDDRPNILLYIKFPEI